MQRQIAADLDPDQLPKYLYTSGQPDRELVDPDLR